MCSYWVLADRDSAHTKRAEDMTSPDSDPKRKATVDNQQVSDCNISSVMLFYSQGIQDTPDQIAAATICIPLKDPAWYILVYLAFTIIIIYEKDFLHFFCCSFFYRRAPIHSHSFSRKYVSAIQTLEYYYWPDHRSSTAHYEDSVV